MREAARTGSGGLWGYGKEAERFQDADEPEKDGNPPKKKLTAKRLELVQVESEIEKLLDTLTGATPVLLSYVNSRIAELDAKRQTIANEVAKLSADAVPMEQIESISGYLDDWENVSFEDKRQVVDALITVIRATNEKVEIEWKI